MRLRPHLPSYLFYFCRKQVHAPLGSDRRFPMPEYRLHINDQTQTVDADPDTPLLYVLIDDLALKGPRFGCGLAQCGSCSVLADGVEIRSCVTPVSSIQDREITTLEGLAEWYRARQGLREAPSLHPVQQAMIDEQAVQCGYCFNGMIVKACELLSNSPRPSEDQVRAAMNGHLCRCGTYPRILSAIQRASEAMGEER